MGKKLLLVEDDGAIAEMVIGHLLKDGCDTLRAADGEQALDLLAAHSFDLLLLDLMLPGMDGIELLKRVRQSSFVPILILSAKDGEIDKALGLGFGADDYMTKPFSLIELSARVGAALRRATQYSPAARQETYPEPMVRIHELTLDHDGLRVWKNGREIGLTAKELHILKLLMTHPRRAFSKEQIYRTVWNDEYFGDQNAIQVHISRLRDKIEDVPASPRYIKTVWGIGYKLGEF